MLIPLAKILGRNTQHPNRCHDVIENSMQYFEDGGIETKDPTIKDADIIALVMARRTIFRAVPGYFVGGDKIIVNDPKRSFIDNVKNEIFINGFINQVDGHSFTMIQINTPEQQSSTGCKYYHSAIWLI